MSSSKRLYMTGAVSIAKYALPMNRMVHVIGEEHVLDLSKCTRYPQIHVSDHVKIKMSESDDAILLMEYPPDMSLSQVRYESANMNELREAILALNADDRTFGIDTRRKFIDSDVLYTKSVYDLTYADLLNNFWEPLIRQDTFKLTETSYKKKDYDFLVEYVASKKKNIRWFYDNIVKKIDLKARVRDKTIMLNANSDVVQFLRRIWADVSDLKILEIVLSKTNTTFIIVVGNKHAENIRDMFKNYEISYMRADDKFRCIALS